MERKKRIIRKVGTSHRRMVTDSEYSSKKVGKAVDEAVIPYQSNQKSGVKGILKVDKKFRTGVPENQKRNYHKRPTIETDFNFPKNPERPSHKQG